MGLLGKGWALNRHLLVVAALNVNHTGAGADWDAVAIMEPVFGVL